jgi:hypothetical protein
MLTCQSKRKQSVGIKHNTTSIVNNTFLLQNSCLLFEERKHFFLNKNQTEALQLYKS